MEILLLAPRKEAQEIWDEHKKTGGNTKPSDVTETDDLERALTLLQKGETKIIVVHGISNPQPHLKKIREACQEVTIIVVCRWQLTWVDITKNTRQTVLPTLVWRMITVRLNEHNEYKKGGIP